MVLLLVCGIVGVAHSQNSDQETSGDRWYKGNLHTHSLWSDGNDFPEMIALWYRDHGYQFLSLTDHNILSIGDRWMDKEKILQRGDDSVFAKYETAWPDDWIETRDDPKTGKQQYRLKPLPEFRTKLEQPEKFLLIQGEEISDRSEGAPVHLNAINLVSLIQPVGGDTVSATIANNVRAAEEQAIASSQPILVQLNHPNFGWAVTAEDLVAATNGKFMEVYNGHPSINHLGDSQRPGVERLWDIANTIRIGQLGVDPILGTATDDSHHYHGARTGMRGSRTGRGWIMVRASQLATNDLLAAISAGDFYCSSGVELENVEYQPAKKTLSLKIKPQGDVEFETQFIGTTSDYRTESKPRLDAEGKPMRATRLYSEDIGRVLATDRSLEPSYQFNGDELFVRAVVTSTRKHPNPSFKGQFEQAWTQPAGWRKKADE